MTPPELAAMVLGDLEIGGKLGLMPNFYELTMEELKQETVFVMSYSRDNDTKVVRYGYKKEEDGWHASLDIRTQAGDVHVGDTIVDDRHVHSLMSVIKNTILPRAAFIEKF